MNYFEKKYISFKRTLKVTLNNIRFNSSKKILNNLKNKYTNKRCFIIGNGPSLTVSDLEKLKNEITFASNRIYKIYDKTNWRPTYYCAQDFNLIKASYEDISRLEADKKFICCIRDHNYRFHINNAVYFPLILKDFYPELPEFSENIIDGVFEGMTVTYALLQIAVYMGFSEIYLLGIDHNYSIDMNANGEIVKKDVQDHFSEDDTIANIPQTFKSELAYKKAKEYADNNGIKIYNATRGGRLEVFERINFDNIIL